MAIADDEPTRFIATAKGAGLDEPFVVSLLRSNGWSEQRVYRTMSAQCAAALGMPVPRRGGTGEYAREAFVYVVDFVALATWTVALNSIFDLLIARWLPDLYGRRASELDLAWPAAAVIVAFALFVALQRWILMRLEGRPELYDSGVRKWLTYAALTAAAPIALGDGVAFLAELLRGELTPRFVLDTIVLVALAGGVFAYYGGSVDRPDRRDVA